MLWSNRSGKFVGRESSGLSCLFRFTNVAVLMPGKRVRPLADFTAQVALELDRLAGSG